MKTIKQLMSSPVVMATVETTVGKLRELMSKYDVGAVPITDEGADAEIMGIVTDTDLRNVKDSTLPVMSVMSTKLCYVNNDDSTATAANLMLKNGIHHLLVKDQEKIVGILSSVDLLELVASKPFSFQPHLFFV
ncbi:cyclic nucleotide-binding/CBS domain-containing protein [Haliscomenobacter hydrossis]|uniref:Signal transduction protein with CBS domains n=1 Tax=Haliscomenobacter hydrossis (strain ATCC 27775 / DSM 1100 / LMG 10767 / O) TaxID=760192 RepID=F4L5G4_HALH1|nr:CBS domain-containing protein [Haliscomenobacter hydrossis]AEE50828.1 putative signal transduction protein with CBS domains [Haliscomenobacter hydrossis DSM 1100]